MKKTMLILLLMLNVNIQQANPFYTAFRICRKIGYLGTIYGVSYCLAQYLNSRNSSRNTDIPYDVANQTLTINTDGRVTIHGQANAKNIVAETEMLDPDRQNHSLLETDTPVSDAPRAAVTQIPTQNKSTQNRWQRFWRWITRSTDRTASVQPNAHLNASAVEPQRQNAEPHSLQTAPAKEPQHESCLLNLLKWIVRPPHRAITHHTLYVPQNFNIEVKAKNGITINGVNGAIDAYSGSSDIRIINPTGNVVVETLGNVDIEHFHGDITAKQFGHFHATRHVADTTSYVTLDDEIQPIQPDYDKTRA